jgi:hypothetical protein
LCESRCDEAFALRLGKRSIAEFTFNAPPHDRQLPIRSE